MSAGRVVLVVSDLLARSRLSEAAAAAGYEVTVQRRVPDPGEPATPGSGSPDQPAHPGLLVIDLDLPGALEGATAWRQACPDVRVVGYAFHIETELIAQARAAGIEVVPHGVTARPARLFSIE